MQRSMLGRVNTQEKAKSAADAAYEGLKARILTGEVVGGAAISELVVSQELGVSRTPVHEAFLRLAAEGLLTLEARKGAVVKPMSPSEAADVLEMREAIEAAAAARVVNGGYADELVPALQPLLHAQSEAIAEGDVQRFVDIDDDLHTAVVVASRNPVAVQFLALLRDRQQRLRHQLMRVRPDQLQPALEQHRALTAALADGDAARYAAVLREHVAVHRGAL